MPKLIVNAGTDQSWEIPLESGVTVLGSDPALPFAISHDTVSPAHCEVHVVDGQVTLRDLGSACGTFVDHAAITEQPLESGQKINLGEVELQFVSDNAVGSPPLPRRIAPAAKVRIASPTEKVQACRSHRATIAIGMRILGLLYRTHQDELGWV